MLFSNGLFTDPTVVYHLVGIGTKNVHSENASGGDLKYEFEHIVGWYR